MQKLNFIQSVDEVTSDETTPEGMPTIRGCKVEKKDNVFPEYYPTGEIPPEEE